MNKSKITKQINFIINKPRIVLALISATTSQEGDKRD